MAPFLFNQYLRLPHWSAPPAPYPLPRDGESSESCTNSNAGIHESVDPRAASCCCPISSHLGISHSASSSSSHSLPNSPIGSPSPRSPTQSSNSNEFRPTCSTFRPIPPKPTFASRITWSPGLKWPSSGHVEFCNVSLRYPTSVLSNQMMSDAAVAATGAFEAESQWQHRHPLFETHASTSTRQREEEVQPTTSAASHATFT
ncbi:unnamed protein product [Protopolystoma xenopodis]|uniref:Uncharacterized protein n=1 Tax=Protopolystoma xenopodis TaxID=117903 RepID=A0A3S5AHF9_9PLAT|nr:unnamed protein product [Protopolystoma xenopodis]